MHKNKVRVVLLKQYDNLMLFMEIVSLYGFGSKISATDDQAKLGDQ